MYNNAIKHEIYHLSCVYSIYDLALHDAHCANGTPSHRLCIRTGIRNIPTLPYKFNGSDVTSVVQSELPLSTVMEDFC